MNYPNTIDLLWARLNGGLNGEDYSNWATGLMVDNIENDDIVYLASNSNLHWEDTEKLFNRIIEYLKFDVPTSSIELCKLIEKSFIYKYKNGIIDELELANECYRLYLKSDYDSEFVFWSQLDEDISMCDSEYGPIFFNIDKNNLCQSINKVLLSEGKLANLQHPHT